jgi:hypothetical protein
VNGNSEEYKVISVSAVVQAVSLKNGNGRSRLIEVRRLVNKWDPHMFKTKAISFPFFF